MWISKMTNFKIYVSNIVYNGYTDFKNDSCQKQYFN